MYSAFISYSVKDEEIARQFHSLLSSAGIDTFLAGISIEPGSDWTEVIFSNLEKAECVFFLASKNSISSAAVQQEIGGSLIQKKTLIPVLIDISPEELPGWVGKHQAIDIKNPSHLQRTISSISKKVKEDKMWAGIIIGLFLAFLAMSLR